MHSDGKQPYAPARHFKDVLRCMSSHGESFTLRLVRPQAE